MPEGAYRPPETELTSAATADPGTPGEIDVNLAISDAWRAMIDCFPLWLAVGAVAVFLMFASFVTIIGAVLLVPVLMWGSIRCLLSMADGRGEFAQLFSGFSEYSSALIGTLAWIVLYMLISLLGESVRLIGQTAGSDAIEGFGGLVNLAWTLGVVLRFGFSYYFMVDRGLGPVESLRASWVYTRGQWLKLFLLFLATIALAFAGVLALLIGLIPAAAMTSFMYASAYRQVSGTRGSAGGAADAPSPS